MQLDITRHFVENKDGTYDLYEPPVQTTTAGFGGKDPIPIRPFELKTYLKVGKQFLVLATRNLYVMHRFDNFKFALYYGTGMQLYWVTLS